MIKIHGYHIWQSGNPSGYKVILGRYRIQPGCRTPSRWNGAGVTFHLVADKKHIV